MHAGQTVSVTMFDGNEMNGTVLSMAESILELDSATGKLSISLKDVRTIEAPDSLKNGARNGAIAGGLSCALFLGSIASGLKCESDCGPDYNGTRDVIGTAAFGGALGAGAGALVGLLVDHRISGRRVVYSAPSTQSTSWTIRPAIAEQEFRVSATLTW